jgi:TRAP-type C4-dicarboxylate transport system substrate-binding protein
LQAKYCNGFPQWKDFPVKRYFTPGCLIQAASSSPYFETQDKDSPMKLHRKTMALALTLLVAAMPALAQDIQERTIKFGHLNNADHPVSFGVKRFSELVAAKSGGKMKVMEYPASTLGNELQQQSALQGGVQEMSAPATTSLAGIVKEFGLVDFPFAVSTFAQADALLDGPLGQALIARLPEKGLVALGYWDLGFRNVTNSKRPITGRKTWTA